MANQHLKDCLLAASNALAVSVAACARTTADNRQYASVVPNGARRERRIATAAARAHQQMRKVHLQIAELHKENQVLHAKTDAVLGSKRLADLLAGLNDLDARITSTTADNRALKTATLSMEGTLSRMDDQSSSDKIGDQISQVVHRNKVLAAQVHWPPSCSLVFPSVAAFNTVEGAGARNDDARGTAESTKYQAGYKAATDARGIRGQGNEGADNVSNESGNNKRLVVERRTNETPEGQCSWRLTPSFSLMWFGASC